MDGTMRERIARAMADKLDAHDGAGDPIQDASGLHDALPCGFVDLFEVADAVLDAMREPTKAMTEAGWEHTGDPCWEENVADAWRAMIDAARTPAKES